MACELENSVATNDLDESTTNGHSNGDDGSALADDSTRKSPGKAQRIGGDLEERIFECSEDISSPSKVFGKRQFEVSPEAQLSMHQLQLEHMRRQQEVRFFKVFEWNKIQIIDFYFL